MEIINSIVENMRIIVCEGTTSLQNMSSPVVLFILVIYCAEVKS